MVRVKHLLVIIKRIRCVGRRIDARRSVEMWRSVEVLTLEDGVDRFF